MTKEQKKMGSSSSSIVKFDFVGVPYEYLTRPTLPLNDRSCDDWAAKEQLLPISRFLLDSFNQYPWAAWNNRLMHVPQSGKPSGQKACRHALNSNIFGVNNSLCYLAMMTAKIIDFFSLKKNKHHKSSIGTPLVSRLITRLKLFYKF